MGNQFILYNTKISIKVFNYPWVMISI